MMILARILVWMSLASVSTSMQPLSNSEDGWAILAKVKFIQKFFAEYNEYYLSPFFDSGIRAREGKEFILRGHYLPLDLSDRKTIILSKVPYSMCFFCGGAGPESVVEIVFTEKAPRFKSDQVITVKGILKLNETDINHMNFILTNASLVVN